MMPDVDGVKSICGGPRLPNLFPFYKPMSDSRVEQLLEDIKLVSVARHDLVQEVRSSILGLNDRISEQVKYGGILFSADQPFCGIFSYTHHVSLEFGDGAALPDQFKVLEGTGKQRRHIKLFTQTDVVDKCVSHYLGLALSASQKA
ncbi:DUF1801 domain-containing protein [Chitinimonas lacunae]|uniref:DUF1801 domain-containing protein n=1 Tax=Chitinimonas lacunae TaxID=1963018 RepID=A0ABV8MLX6_9NEIS